MDNLVIFAQTTIEEFQDKIKNKVFEIEKYVKVDLSTISINLDEKRKPVTSSDRKKGAYPYYGASGIIDYVDGYVIDDYVLLISEDGANLKSRVYPIAFTVEGKAWVNNHAHIIKFENKMTHKLIESYLNQIDLSDYLTGMAQPKLSQTNLNRIKIPLPPIEIQKQIVAEIEKLEAKISEAKTIIESAQAQKEAILKIYLE